MKACMFRAEPEQIPIIGRHFAQTTPMPFGICLLEKGVEGAQGRTLHLKGAPQLAGACQVALILFIIKCGC